MRTSFAVAVIAQWMFSANGFAVDVISDAIPLGQGTIHVVCPERLNTTRPELLIHFHGAPQVARENFERFELPGVLLTVNYKGLSSAYSRPFRESADLFAQLLDVGLSEVARMTNTSPTEWNRISLSSFSAGYGAVREILKNPAQFERVSGIVAADSIYASLQEEATGRVVSPLQMRNFRRFAELAVRGQKTFIVTHTYLETPYASSFETADDILSFVQVERVRSTDQGELTTAPLALRNIAKKGRLTVLGYEGTDGAAHMQHLRNIGRWWKLLAAE